MIRFAAMKYHASGISALLVLLFSMPAQGRPANLDCGGLGGFFAGNFYEADREYTAANGSGSIGGQVSALPGIFSTVIEGSDKSNLFSTARTAPAEYRFDLPNGDYALTLHFAELLESGPGLRQFTVFAEGAPVISNLDVYALVGKFYALTYRYAVKVTDGQLNVTFSGEGKPPLIAGIGVAAVQRDSVPPPVPVMTAAGGYNRNILSWTNVSAPDLAGYAVYRSSSAAGPFTAVSSSPVPFTHYYDDSVAPGQTAYYRVASVDIFANTSFPSTIVSARPRSKTESALPVYELSLSPQNLATMRKDVFSDEYVDADFSYAGELYPDIGVRFRGESSRIYNKMSWRVNFKGSKPFEGRDKLNTKAMVADPSLIRECLATYIFQPLAVPVGQCGFVHLEVNSEFMGVFTKLELPDEDFLRLRGLDVNGRLFEAKGPLNGNFSILADYSEGWEDDSTVEEGFDALASLIKLINATPDATFDTTIASVLNVDSWLDYYAGLTLSANIDHTGHNYYAYKSPQSPIWEILPKDHDLTFTFEDLPLTHGTKATPDRNFGTYNVLTDRILKFPRFRQWLANKLFELLITDFTTARMNVEIQREHQIIRDDAMLDVYKVSRERNALFLSSPSDLSAFVRNRWSYIFNHLSSLSPGVSQPIMLNEVVPLNVSGLRDEAGEFEEWIEVYNPGLFPYDLSGHYLTDDPKSKTKWRFPAGTTVPGFGHLLVWADGQTSQGPLHASFKLNGQGGAVALMGPDTRGNELLDVIGYRAMQADTSHGRRFSGSSLWTRQKPTPRAANVRQQ